MLLKNFIQVKFVPLTFIRPFYKNCSESRIGLERYSFGTWQKSCKSNFVTKLFVPFVDSHPRSSTNQCAHLPKQPMTVGWPRHVTHWTEEPNSQHIYVYCIGHHECRDPKNDQGMLSSMSTKLMYLFQYFFLRIEHHFWCGEKWYPNSEATLYILYLAFTPQNLAQTVEE